MLYKLLSLSGYNKYVAGRMLVVHRDRIASNDDNNITQEKACTANKIKQEFTNPDACNCHFKISESYTL